MLYFIFSIPMVVVISIWTSMKNIYQATEYGKEILDPRSWSSKATLAQSIAGLLMVGLPLTCEFLDVCPKWDNVDIQSIGNGVALVLMYFADRAHVASNPHAGRMPVKSDD